MKKSIMNKDVTNKQLEKSWKLYGIKYPDGLGCKWQKTKLKLKIFLENSIPSVYIDFWLGYIRALGLCVSLDPILYSVGFTLSFAPLVFMFVTGNYCSLQGEKLFYFP